MMYDRIENLLLLHKFRYIHLTYLYIIGYLKLFLLRNKQIKSAKNLF